MSGEIFVIGISHHTAPLELREKLAVSRDGLDAALRALRADVHATEAMLVSTCNRVEVWAAAANAADAMESARAHLATCASPTDVKPFLYERRGEQAVRHAFRVAASLDSMVLGEPQILGQVKESFSAASAQGAIGALLGRCFTRAFAVAKRVRTETTIAAGVVSVSSIAVELARKIFGDLAGRRVLLVGAGKMSEAAARSLRKQGARLFVVNRSPERAAEVAKLYGGEPRAFESLATELTQADVVVTSTASPRFVITTEIMSGVMKARRHKPLFLIDIAVPRDVDPRVGELDNVFLYDVDDLQKVSHENLALRQKETEHAEKIVEGEVQQFESWRRSLDLTPTIVALRERFRDVVKKELERTVPRLKNVSEEERRTLDAMAEAMVNKLLHQPLVELKKGADAPEGAALITAARKLFDLEKDIADRTEQAKQQAAASDKATPDGPLTPAADAGPTRERT